MIFYVFVDFNDFATFVLDTKFLTFFILLTFNHCVFFATSYVIMFEVLFA